uniref:Uncharacterized protein n=1 Tax=Ciona savignyi TaxID=51511 RepID=H2Y4W4_CIOSA
MVSNVTTPTAVATKPTAKVAVISGINFAVTVLATVFGTTFVLQSLVPNLGLRVGIGLAVASMLVCIEIFLAVRAVEKAESEISKKKSTLQLN